MRADVSFRLKHRCAASQTFQVAFGVWRIFPGQLCLAAVGRIGLQSAATSSASLIALSVSPLSFPKVKRKVTFLVITQYRNARRNAIVAAFRWDQSLYTIRLLYICQRTDMSVYVNNVVNIICQNEWFWGWAGLDTIAWVIPFKVGAIFVPWRGSRYHLQCYILANAMVGRFLTSDVKHY